MTTATSTGRRTGGEAVFLATAVAVHAGNYGFNVLMGRRLGPADFAELHLVVTFLLLLTLVTHTVQLAAARATAQLDVTASPGDVDTLHGWLRRRALLVGGGAGVAMILGAPALQQLFASPSPWSYRIFGAGLPFLVVLGADRGLLQGRTAFRRLAVTNVVEMLVRLLGAMALVAIGLGVPGAVAAITASFVAAWAVARPVHTRPAKHAADLERLRTSVPLLLGPSLALLAGQVLAANGDVLVVKATSPAEAAGRYAVLALIGRVVFYATATMVEVGFPLVARRASAGRDTGSLLRGQLIATMAMGAVAVITLAFAGERVVVAAFGADYASIAPLAWRYTLATAFFSVAYVLASDALAQGRGRPAGLLVVGGVVQLVAVVASRGDLGAVVDAQVACMALLVAATAVARRRRSAVRPPEPATPAHPVHTPAPDQPVPLLPPSLSAPTTVGA